VTGREETGSSTHHPSTVKSPYSPYESHHSHLASHLNSQEYATIAVPLVCCSLQPLSAAEWSY
jgi:hypothetical protein